MPQKPNGEPYYFVEIFAYVDIDTKNPKGPLVQTVNGEEASYVRPLAEGDEIYIQWLVDKAM